MARTGLKKLWDYATKEGWVNGHSFPRGSYIHFDSDSGEKAIRITYPNGQDFVITHDMVKYAAIIATGVIELRSNNNGGNTLIYGCKIRFELNDGKSGVITTNLGNPLDRIEEVMF